MLTTENSIADNKRQCSRCHAIYPDTAEFFYKKQGRCKRCAKEVAALWAKNNPHRRKEIVSLSDRRHSIARAAKRKEWTRANKERKNRATQEWREKNRARFNQLSRDSRRRRYSSNPEKILSQNREYRARRHGGKVGLGFSAKEWKAVLDMFGNKCAYCGKEGKLTQDHITPLSRGGHHSIQNIVPACHSCNSKKKDKDPLKPVQPLLLAPVLQPTMAV